MVNATRLVVQHNVLRWPIIHVVLPYEARCVDFHSILHETGHMAVVQKATKKVYKILELL